ncbi:hypothetical protein ACO0SA_002532 [Hanseniaspora valbyensis]
MAQNITSNDTSLEMKSFGSTDNFSQGSTSKNKNNNNNNSNPQILKKVTKKQQGYFDEHDLDVKQSINFDESDGENVSDHEAQTGTVEETQVKRALKSRHLQMIALGGTLGTGLFVGSGSALSNSGPVGCLIAYSFMASIVLCICQALGEMSTFIPVSSALTVFPGKFLSKSIGFSNSWLYFFNWAITYAVEISVIPQLIDYWNDDVPMWVWILIFWIIITAANFAKVSIYGEVEFVLASIKVLAIIGFLIFALCMVCGAGKDGAVGFRYWRNPGPFNGIISKDPNTAKFLGFVSTFVYSAFSYQGAEMSSVLSGEVKNRKAISRAFNKVFFRLALFYIGSIFFISLLVPYNDPRLSSTESEIASSPFVIAMQRSGVKVLPSIFNAIVLTAVISAANSDLMVGSRVLYSMGLNKTAPHIFSKTRYGVPMYAVGLTSLFGLLGFLVVGGNSANQAFDWLLNISALAGTIQWFFISLCHIRFRAALSFKGIPLSDLLFTARTGLWGSYYSLFFLTIIIFVQGFQAFSPKFNVSDFFAAYISMIVWAVAYIGSQLYYRCKLWLSVDEIDIDSDRRAIDETVWEEDEKPRYDTKNRIMKFFYSVLD